MKSNIINMGSLIVSGTVQTARIYPQRNFDKSATLQLSITNAGNITGGEFFLVGKPASGAKDVTLSGGTILTGIDADTLYFDVPLMPQVVALITGGNFTSTAPVCTVYLQQ